jgi:signal transduction histidine kinase
MFNEAARLRKLYQMELLDTPAERDFDEIVQLASQLARTPISLITLLDTDRQWFKAKVGMDALGTDRPSAVCNYTIQGDTLFEVEDLLADRRFEKNLLVKNGPKLRYYAGMPLITSDGYRLGALCVIDTKSRNKLTEDQAFALGVLARQAMTQIELRVKNKELGTLKVIADKLVGAVGEESETAVGRLKDILLGLRDNHLKGHELEVELANLQRTLGSADRSFANIVAWSKLHALSDNKDTTTKLHPLVNESIAEMNAGFTAKGNTITLEVTDKAIVPAPNDAVKFIIRNLLDNANKYTSNGQISLRYFTSAGSLDKSPRHYICVSDTGIGMPDASIQAFAADGELPVRPGTDGETGHGHGLMLTRHVLHHFGGKLHLESSSGNHCNVIAIL